MLLSLRPSDIDLVCQHAENVASEIAKNRNASMTMIKKRKGFETYRLSDPCDRNNFIDISELFGETIADDLSKRDFTVNAMAIPINLPGVLGNVIDPFGGKADLEQGFIRSIEPGVFVTDPLRLLMAVRFAQSLGFVVSDETSGQIRNHRFRLQNIAPERILSEWLEILKAGRSHVYVKLMDDLGLMEVVFPETVSMKVCTQNSYHHLDVWHHSLMVMENCEYILEHLEPFFDPFASQVREILSQENRIALLKMAALFHDVGKPSTRAVNKNTGRITFYGHDRAGADIIGNMAQRLRMSNQNRAFLQLLVSEHLHVLNLSNPEVKQGTRLNWFRKFKDNCILILILGMADIKATLGPDSRKTDRDNQIRWSRHAAGDYFFRIKQTLERKDLITGKDLMAIGISPGPEMGRLIKEVRKAQDQGEVKTKTDALSLVKELTNP
jgi:putative nucleotidyltransferase with HDIG domain